MDTKLKKSHKLKKWIIAMIVLLPAFMLVSLYPKMEQSMLERKEELLEIWRENAADYVRKNDLGTGSFRTILIDNLYKLTAEELANFEQIYTRLTEEVCNQHNESIAPIIAYNEKKIQNWVAVQLEQLQVQIAEARKEVENYLFEEMMATDSLHKKDILFSRNAFSHTLMTNL